MKGCSSIIYFLKIVQNYFTLSKKDFQWLTVKTVLVSFVKFKLRSISY